VSSRKRGYLRVIMLGSGGFLWPWLLYSDDCAFMGLVCWRGEVQALPSVNFIECG
jgi:hypothetical protein